MFRETTKPSTRSEWWAFEQRNINHGPSPQRYMKGYGGEDNYKNRTRMYLERVYSVHVSRSSWRGICNNLLLNGHLESLFKARVMHDKMYLFYSR